MRTRCRVSPLHRFSKPALSATQPPLQVIVPSRFSFDSSLLTYCPVHPPLQPVSYKTLTPERLQHPGRVHNNNRSEEPSPCPNPILPRPPLPASLPNRPPTSRCSRKPLGNGPRKSGA